MQVSINISQEAAEYVIPLSDQTANCMSSWNKLYGSSRCFGSLHHENSDRFAWRRAQSCLKYDGNNVTVLPDCPDANKIEIAAYAYNKGEKPYQHIGTLLKQFNTLVTTGTLYQYELVVADTETTYNLKDADGNLLETVVVAHSKCFWPDFGYTLGW
eukprot:CAMPEP_0114984444 /NCGR_PEP_ID=MMETSP0216-20121206/7280_1 /TAXON_ID=223996 /ORGANISM="Protocruzia adherens, Strain Boccale" /LENGTH=156 /DNA_ID=CAMNT_0002346581 /DNA_START=200 /DNA_END=667 /DNA_ORIENTATION=+